MSNERPLLVYDDDCGVCTRAAVWLVERDGIDLIGYSEVGEDLVERLPKDWRRCAHLVTDDGVYSCGDAMERAFLRTDHWATGPVGIARSVPGYPRLREFGYRVFADNRAIAGRLSR